MKRPSILPRYEYQRANKSTRHKMKSWGKIIEATLETRVRVSINTWKHVE